MNRKQTVNDDKARAIISPRFAHRLPIIAYFLDSALQRRFRAGVIMKCTFRSACRAHTTADIHCSQETHDAPKPACTIGADWKVPRKPDATYFYIRYGRQKYDSLLMSQKRSITRPIMFFISCNVKLRKITQLIIAKCIEIKNKILLQMN